MYIAVVDLLIEVQCNNLRIITLCCFVTQKSVEPLLKLFEKYVNKSLEFRRTKCRELVPTSHLNAVVSLCMLLDTFATAENGVSSCIIYTL